MSQIKTGISALGRILGAAEGCILVFSVYAYMGGLSPWRSHHMIKQHPLEEKSSEFSLSSYLDKSKKRGKTINEEIRKIHSNFMFDCELNSCCDH